MNDHTCISRDDIKDISDNVNDLKTDVAMVKKDTQDLKDLSASMSKCIEVLTKSSIVSQESHITREQFYKKIDEIVVARHDVVNACMKEFYTYKEEADTRMDRIDSRIVQNRNVCDDYREMKKVIQGLVVAVVLFLILEGYRVLVA